MFHVISQSVSWLLAPTNILVVLILAGVLLALHRRLTGFGLRLTAVAASILSLLGILPVGDWFLIPLETRFPDYTHGSGAPAGIIILGGSVSLAGGSDRLYHQPNEAADRLFAAARLARRYPTARVLVSGGPIDPFSNNSEADFVAADLIELGVAPARLIRERRSADTFQNAQFSKAIVHPKSGEHWALVTSAFHMPRAVASFRAAGFQVVAAPADWRAGYEGRIYPWSVGANLKKADLAWKEYLGLAVYRFSGRTKELFPAP